jgi:hypothetical protein
MDSGSVMFGMLFCIILCCICSSLSSIFGRTKEKYYINKKNNKEKNKNQCIMC